MPTTKNCGVTKMFKRRKATFTVAETKELEFIKAKNAELETEIAELKTYINSLGKTELIGTGSADEPFVWYEGIELIPNAYYTHHETRFVWMGEHRTATADDVPFDDGGNWVEF